MMRRRLHTVTPICVFIGAALICLLHGSTRAAAGTINGTFEGDNCQPPITDSHTPADCTVLDGPGFAVEAFLAISAGADCCGLPQRGRCLVSSALTFDVPFPAPPAVTFQDPNCETLGTPTARGFELQCEGYNPLHAISFVAAGPGGGGAPCTGDCENQAMVTIADLVKGVAMALGLLPIDACPAFDDNHDGLVTIDEVVHGVDNALYGCGSGIPSPTPSPLPSATSTATPLPRTSTPATPTTTPQSCPSDFGTASSGGVGCVYNGGWQDLFSDCEGNDHENLAAVWVSDGHLIAAVVAADFPIFFGAVIDPTDSRRAIIFSVETRDGWQDLNGTLMVPNQRQLYLSTPTFAPTLCDLTACTQNECAFNLCTQ